MSIDAKQIAQFIVNWFITIKKPLNNLKLQNLLYFSWIDYYKAATTWLFGNKFVAWPLGPAIPIVYYSFCDYGGEPITEKNPANVQGINTDVLFRTLIKNENKSAFALAKRTQHENGAWLQIYQNGFGRDEKIPFELIIEKECLAL